VERITDVFPAAQQPQVRLQLSSVLAGIMTQRLLKRADKQGRVAAFEIMLATPAIRNLIREAKLHEIPSYISMNAKLGMRTLEQFLAEQVRQGTINIEHARETANDRTQLDTLLGPGAGALKARVSH
jgi:twitching motility protein PilT